MQICFLLCVPRELVLPVGLFSLTFYCSTPILVIQGTATPKKGELY
nr:MAG TPA: hypothetical protein [Caudoviricetes sp.]